MEALEAIHRKIMLKNIDPHSKWFKVFKSILSLPTPEPGVVPWVRLACEAKDRAVTRNALRNAIRRWLPSRAFCLNVRWVPQDGCIAIFYAR